MRSFHSLERVRSKSEKVLNEEALNVHGLDDKMRWWFMEDGLCPESFFQIDVRVNRPRNLKEFLQRSSRYMDYEDDELATQVLGKTIAKKEVQSQKTRQKKDNGSFQREIPLGLRS